MNLLKLIMMQKLFSLKTFGPKPRLKGVHNHLRKEIIELIANITDLSEWADCFLLSIDGALRAGMPISILSGILHLDREDLITNRPDFIKRYIYQLKNEICNLSNTVDNEYRWAFIARKIIINAEINGITNDLLIESAFSKLEINKSRKWPDWRTVDENKAIEHLKSKKHSINVGKDNNDKKK